MDHPVIFSKGDIREVDAAVGCDGWPFGESAFDFGGAGKEQFEPGSFLDQPVALRVGDVGGVGE